MNITDVRTIPLFGETPMTGWTVEPGPDENMHTLVEVQTDEGERHWKCFYQQSPGRWGDGVVAPQYHWGERAGTRARI